MRKQAPGLAAAAIVLSSIAGCSASTRQPPAEVTGFASVPVTSMAPAGPVGVRVTGTQAARLARLVSQLPSAGRSQPHCQEPPGLMYRIAFAAGSVAASQEVVEGYRCEAAVAVTVGGKAAAWRRDAACALIRAVRQLLPAQAKATQSLNIGCL